MEFKKNQWYIEHNTAGTPSLYFQIADRCLFLLQKVNYRMMELTESTYVVGPDHYIEGLKEAAEENPQISFTEIEEEAIMYLLNPIGIAKYRMIKDG